MEIRQNVQVGLLLFNRTVSSTVRYRFFQKTDSLLWALLIDIYSNFKLLLSCSISQRVCFKRAWSQMDKRAVQTPCLKEKQMLISPWMTTEAISVQPDTSLSRCQKLMKEHGVRRLPVVDDSNRVIGIISDRDVKRASPSKATSLEVHEIQYLLAEVKAKDIMTSNPICVKSNESISKVALIMLDKKIGGMPVVDDDNHLLGIITDQDVFRVLVTIGGARDPGIELTVETSQEPGSLARVFDIVRKNKGRIVSVMTAYLANGNRHVFIRLRPFEDESASASLKEALETQTNLLEWTICSGMAD